MVLVCADAHHDYFKNRGLKTDICLVFTSQNKNTMTEQKKSGTLICINCFLFICYSDHNVRFDYRLCNVPRKKYVENEGSGDSPTQCATTCPLFKKN